MMNQGKTFRLTESQWKVFENVREELEKLYIIIGQDERPTNNQVLGFLLAQWEGKSVTFIHEQKTT